MEPQIYKKKIKFHRKKKKKRGWKLKLTKEKPSRKKQEKIEEGVKEN